MTNETIVAVYDNAEHAEAAVRDLLAANVPSDAISRHAGAHSTNADASSATSTSTNPSQKQGFWSGVFGGEPDHDTSVYDRSIESGSTVVTVNTPQQHVEAVNVILERHGAIDIDERAMAYGSTPATMPAERSSAAASEGNTMQLAEEQLVVGKRLVNRGNTRVRRFVVETPVEQQVSLREETISVQRRPVTDGRTNLDGAFTDKTVEMTETGEEAVIGKTARVYEEVGVRKQASEHVETVRDTVRREDVEVTHSDAGTLPEGQAARPRV